MKEDFKTLKQLLIDNNGSEPTYDELLSTKEWRDHRKVILKRDKHQCQVCKKKENELAWELNGTAPFPIYIRKYDEFEKKIFGEDFEYSSKHIELHVHHKYYIKDHYPWHYLDNALITVCSECHEKIHETEEILVYDDIDKAKILPAQRCGRCKGKGYLNEYKYYMRGICFSCDGKGYRIL